VKLVVNFNTDASIGKNDNLKSSYNARRASVKMQLPALRVKLSEFGSNNWNRTNKTQAAGINM